MIIQPPQTKEEVDKIKNTLNKSLKFNQRKLSKLSQKIDLLNEEATTIETQIINLKNQLKKYD